MAPPPGGRRLAPDAVLPRRAHPGDAGYDLCALEDLVLGPGERAMVRTGLALALPNGHAGRCLPPPRLAGRHGIALVNAPGLIDAGYRGEVRVLLLNTDPAADFAVAAGDRIAQLVVATVAAPEVVEVDALDDSARAEGGFGSAGR